MDTDQDIQWHENETGIYIKLEKLYSCCNFQVRFICQSGKETRAELIKEVLGKFYGNYVGFYSGDILLLFDVPSAFPLKKMTTSKPEWSTNWFLKSSNTVYDIGRQYLAALVRSVTKDFTNLNERKPCTFYDVSASARRFRPFNDTLHFSRRLKVLDSVVSLAAYRDKELIQVTNKNRLESEGPFLTKSHVPPYLSKGHHFDEAKQIYPGEECTDGPTENVVYSVTSSIQVNLDQGASYPPRPRPRGRYPDYQDERTRYQSFATWPHRADVQDVSKLAQYGFFFTGQFDLARCYMCGLGLKDWSHSDDAVREHVRYSPNCAHLEELLGTEHLQQYRDSTLPERTRLNEAGNSYGQQIILRHPEFKNPEIRRKTYEKWPRDLRQTPEELTEAGFFYTGFQDQVRCYACDGGLQHWDTDDEPWIEHARWFPHCWHVIQKKGQTYITMVQLALAETDEETGSVSGAMELMAVNGASGGRESENPIYSPAAHGVINLGFSRAAVQMAIDECTQKGRSWNMEILLDVLLEKQDKGETLPADSPRSKSPVQPEIDASTDEGVLIENNRLRKRLICILCEENNVDILFLPCSHHKMCRECAADAEICPICGKEIKEKVKTYMV